MTPGAIAEQLAELRDAASAFSVKAVAVHLEQAAQEALAVAQTEDEVETAQQLLVAARRARYGALIRRP